MCFSWLPAARRNTEHEKRPEKKNCNFKIQLKKFWQPCTLSTTVWAHGRENKAVTARTQKVEAYSHETQIAREPSKMRKRRRKCKKDRHHLKDNVHRAPTGQDQQNLCLKSEGGEAADCQWFVPFLPVVSCFQWSRCWRAFFWEALWLCMRVPDILQVHATTQTWDDKSKSGPYCELFFRLASHETGDAPDSEAPTNQQEIGHYMDDIFTEEKFWHSAVAVAESPCEMAVCLVFHSVWLQCELAVRLGAAHFHGITHICSNAAHFSISSSSNWASDLQSSAVSFSNSLLPTSRLMLQMSFAKVSDVLARTVHLCIAHTQICSLLDVLHLVDSPLLEVEGCGESSIPVSIVVPKFLLVFCESVILKAVGR